MTARQHPQPMQIRFVVKRPLVIRALSLPFALHCTCSRGGQRIEQRRARSLDRDEIHLRPQSTIDYWLLPDITGAAAAIWWIDERSPPAGPLQMLRDAFYEPRHSFSATLSRAVFLYPERPWSLTSIAADLCKPARSVQMRLFRENESFAAIVRRQRLQRALLAVLHASDHEFGQGVQFDLGICSPADQDVLARGLALL